MFALARLSLYFGASSGFLSPVSTPVPSAFQTTISHLLAAKRMSLTRREMYNDVKAVIFDVDGTLADSWKLGYDATLVILEKHGIPPITVDEYHSHTRYATPERLARHCGLSPDDDGFLEVGEKLANEFDDLYVGLVSTETAGFYDDITQLLQNIPPNVALGALTNACVKYADAVLEKNCPVIANGEQSGGIYGRFKSVRGADNVPEPKPSPAGLLQVCNDLGVKPSECVYIGDSPSDGMAAEAAGMRSIAVLWGSHKEESLKNAPFSQFCRTVEELRELLPQ